MIKNGKNTPFGDRRKAEGESAEQKEVKLREEVC